MNRVAVIIIVLLISLASMCGEEGTPVKDRLPSINEIQNLFALANTGQPRIHVMADIKSYEPPRTKEQISAELKLAHDFMRDDDRQTIFRHSEIIV